VTGRSGARSPLAHRASDLAQATGNLAGAGEIAEAAFLTQVNLRVDQEHARHPAIGLPLKPNTVTHRGARAVLWLGPDEWLVVGPPWTSSEIITDLVNAFSEAHHSVVDVSANRAVVELRGGARHELLSKGCSLDLGSDRWSQGKCAQTLLAGVQVILEERLDATRAFFRPSFGNYVTEWFLDATVEYRLTGDNPS
jgi:sarcosine oxidase, subunit gamma